MKSIIKLIFVVALVLNLSFKAVADNNFDFSEHLKQEFLSNVQTYVNSKLSETDAGVVNDLVSELTNSSTTQERKSAIVSAISKTIDSKIGSEASAPVEKVLNDVLSSDDLSNYDVSGAAQSIVNGVALAEASKAIDKIDNLSNSQKQVVKDGIKDLLNNPSMQVATQTVGDIVAESIEKNLGKEAADKTKSFITSLSDKNADSKKAFVEATKAIANQSVHLAKNKLKQEFVENVQEYVSGKLSAEDAKVVNTMVEELVNASTSEERKSAIVSAISKTIDSKVGPEASAPVEKVLNDVLSSDDLSNYDVSGAAQSIVNGFALAEASKAIDKIDNLSDTQKQLAKEGVKQILENPNLKDTTKTLSEIIGESIEKKLGKDVADNTKNLINSIVDPNINTKDAFVDTMDALGEKIVSEGIKRLKEELKEKLVENLKPDEAKAVGVLIDKLYEGNSINDSAAAALYDYLDSKVGSNTATAASNVLQGNGSILEVGIAVGADTLISQIKGMDKLSPDVRNAIIADINESVLNGKGSTANLEQLASEKIEQAYGAETAQKFKDTIDALKNKSQEAWGKSKELLKDIAFAEAEKLLQKELNKLMEKFPILKDVFAALSIDAKTIMGDLKDILSAKNLDQLKKVFQNILNRIVDSLIDWAVNKINEVINKFINNIIKDVTDLIKKLFSKLKGALGRDLADILGILENIIIGQTTYVIQSAATISGDIVKQTGEKLKEKASNKIKASSGNLASPTAPSSSP